MEEKIRLRHPAGKHAVKIERTKYEILSQTILQCLKDQALTHKELFQAVCEDLDAKQIHFYGSVEWYMESVKLDLEAAHLIQRIKEKSKLKFCLTPSN